MGKIYKIEHWVVVGISEGRFYYITKKGYRRGYEIMWPDMTYYGLTLSKFHSNQEAFAFLNVSLEAEKQCVPPWLPQIRNW